MDTEAIINILLSMGIPGIIIACVIYLTHKFVPEVIKLYRDTKENEQKAFAERQKQYEEQTKQIVEVATKANISNERVSAAIEQNTKALEQINSVNREVASNLKELNEIFKIHDRRSEDINVDVKKILENARRTVKA